MCELKQLSFTGPAPPETVLLLIEDAVVAKVSHVVFKQKFVCISTTQVMVGMSMKTWPRQTRLSPQQTKHQHTTTMH